MNLQPRNGVVFYCVALLLSAVLCQSQSLAHISLKASVFPILQNTQPGPVTYIYDEVGRLIGVIASSGDAAAYSYDAVGNMLSIQRYTANQVCIISFTPTHGGPGDLVTIYGTGFSSTPQQNTVAFNGTTAVVDSSSPTQVSVHVPAGATSGPISVITPSGSAVSNSTFTVASSLSITGFSPLIGVSGASVTITGTNFDSVPGNNKLKFNTTSDSIDSLTGTTSIAATVPVNTSSGKLKLATVAGTAISTQDFFIPPDGYVESNVDYMSRISFGNSATVTISNPGNIGLVLFDAIAGQQVQIQSSSNLPACALSLLDPHNQVVVSGPCMAPLNLLSTPLLSTGTYSLEVETLNGTGGQLSLTLTAASAPSSNISIGGAPVTIPAASVPTTLVFNGTAGTHLTIAASHPATNDCGVEMFDPQGSFMGFNSCTSGTSDLFDGGRLPVTGFYTLMVFSTLSPVTLQLNSLADVNSAIFVDGSPVVVTTTASEQYALLTFAETAGQHVGISLTNGTFPACSLNILDPAGIQIGSMDCSGATDTSDIELFSTGTYTLVVTPFFSTGTATFQLTTITDQLATIVPDGTPLAITTTTPGQNTKVTFSAAVGQHLTLQVSAATYANCALTVYRPDGLLLIVPPGPVQDSSGCAQQSGSRFYDIPKAPVTGTYTILLAPSSDATGSVTLQLANTADITGTITVDGSPMTVTTSIPGQNAVLTFSGNAGQNVYFNLTNGTFTSCGFVLYAPPGVGPLISPANAPGCSGSSTFIDARKLPITGTYTIELLPEAPITGSLTVQVKSQPADVTGSITIDGPPVTVTTQSVTQDARLTFNATAGQRIFIYATAITNPQAEIWLLGTDSSLLATATIMPCCPSFLDTLALPSTGTYTIWIRHAETNTGSETIHLVSVPADVSSTITVGGPAVTVSTVIGQNAILNFTGTAGQKVIGLFTGSTYGACINTLTDLTTGAVLYQGIECVNNGTMDQEITLAESGPYQLLIDPSGTATGSATVQLVYQPNDVVGNIPIDGAAVTVTTAQYQDARMTFSGTAGQSVILLETNKTNPFFFLHVLDPSGNEVSTSIMVAGLPSTGTYTIWIQHDLTYSGSVTLQLLSTPVATFVVNGPTQTLSASLPEEVAFSGTAGQSITITVAEHVTTSISLSVDVWEPNGNNLGSCSGGKNFTCQVNLFVSGTYRVVLTPAQPVTFDLTVTSP